MKKAKSPGKVNGKAIERLELEQVADGAKVTIFYKFHFLENPGVGKATLLVTKDQMDVTRGYAESQPSITDYFFEVGKILGLEEDGGTVDWNLVKEVPDDYLAAHPECNEGNNPCQVAVAPGVSKWVAERKRYKE